MGNVRSLRKNGDKLILGGCTYTIKDVEGCGEIRSYIMRYIMII